MDDRTLAILQARTRRYAAKPDEARTEEITLGTFVGYRVGELTFGLPSTIVHEFAALHQWTPFEGKEFLIGITHLRGDVMSLIDLLKAVTGKPSPACQWMVVLQGRGGRVAAPAGEIIGIRQIEMKELLPPEQCPISSPLIMATTGDLWLVLDEQKLGAVFHGLPVLETDNRRTE